MKDTKIISVFPGGGKSDFIKKYGNNLTILDFDKSRFSWVYNEEWVKDISKYLNFDWNAIKDKILLEWSKMLYDTEDKYNLTMNKSDIITSYIDNIKENIGKVDIIFVSAQDNVLKSLADNAINHIVIYPNLLTTCKYTWINKYIEIGDDEVFVELMKERFFDLIMSIEKMENDYIVLRPIEDSESASNVITGLLPDLLGVCL